MYRIFQKLIARDLLFLFHTASVTLSEIRQPKYSFYLYVSYLFRSCRACFAFQLHNTQFCLLLLFFFFIWNIRAKAGI